MKQFLAARLPVCGLPRAIAAKRTGLTPHHAARGMKGDTMKRTIATIALCIFHTFAGAQTASHSFPALGVQGGRFVLGQLSDFQRDKFLLDTQTGRVWVMVCTDDKGAQCWRGFQSMQFLDAKGESVSISPPQTK